MSNEFRKALEDLPKLRDLSSDKSIKEFRDDNLNWLCDNYLVIGKALLIADKHIQDTSKEPDDCNGTPEC